MYSKDTVYFSGSARLPSTIPSGGMYELINVGMMIDTKTGQIVDVSATLLSTGAKRFLDDLIIGHNLHEEGINALIDEINDRYFGDSQKAIIMAIKNAYEKYEKYKKQRKIK